MEYNAIYGINIRFVRYEAALRCRAVQSGIPHERWLRSPEYNHN
jgi:hypothetical protein